MVNRKRDRWDSSSDEDDDVKPSVQNIQTSRSPENVNVDNSITASSQAGKIKEFQSDGVKEEETINNNHHNNNNNGHCQETPISSSLPTHNPLLMGCRSVYSCYERLAHLDEGTYGVVWKARDCGTKNQNYQFPYV